MEDLSKREILQKNYQDIQDKLSKVSDFDKKNIIDLRENLIKKLKKSSFQKFFDDPKQAVKDIIDSLGNITIKDIAKMIGPTLIAISSVRLYMYIKKAMNGSNLEDPTWNLFLKFLIAFIVTEIFLLILETYYIRNQIEDDETTISKIFKESSENWKRYWQEFKNGDYAEMLKDMIKSNLIVYYHELGWQFELAKKDTGYAVILSLNWILTILCITTGYKVLVNKLSGAV